MRKPRSERRSWRKALVGTGIAGAGPRTRYAISSRPSDIPGALQKQVWGYTVLSKVPDVRFRFISDLWGSPDKRESV